MNGYFVGNFFGKKDTWAEIKENLIFLTEQEVKALFSDFELIQFNEIEKDAIIASGEKNIDTYMMLLHRKKSNILCTFDITLAFLQCDLKAVNKNI